MKCNLHLEIKAYISLADKETNAFATEIIALLEQPDIFERSRKQGHMTASAWIVDPQQQKVVLLHHAKLKKWFQPGGHADGEVDLLAVARKELNEETGLLKIQLHKKEIFDIDIHEIPSNPRESAHFHYDVRFIFIGDANEQPVINHESNKVEWVSWDQVERRVHNERSIMRMLDKTRTYLSAGSFS